VDEAEYAINGKVGYTHLTTMPIKIFMTAGRCYMVTLNRHNELKKLPGILKPDSRRRVVLPAEALSREDTIFYVYTNPAGQIILDPQIPIPASEAWLFEDKAALSAMDKSFKESTRGKLVDMGSFARHARNAA
jgi:hypothetical protein